VKLPLPRLEYEILLCHAYNITQAELLAHPEKYPTEDPGFQKLVERRLGHEPLAYIVGSQPFLGLDFFVDRNVLIPRPETEQLVELAINKLQKTCLPAGMAKNQLQIADIGTGCGCIAISLAKRLPTSEVIGIDASAEALKVARKNAERHAADNCRFLLGDLLEALENKADLIVSNPPYIPAAEIEKLQPDVKDWEPRGALDGGPDGLHYIREIIRGAPNHLNPKGLLLLEFGFDQAPAVAELASKYFKRVEIHKDYSGLERFLAAQ
jgi:release factor glutamine methyltransferase